MPTLFLICKRHCWIYFCSVSKVIQKLGLVIFGILFQDLDTHRHMFCQVAFSDKHISRYYTFENMHIKIRSNEGTVIPDLTHKHSHTCYYNLQEGKWCEYIHLFTIFQPKIARPLSLKTKGLSSIPLLPLPWAILNKDSRFWYADPLLCAPTGWGRALDRQIRECAPSLPISSIQHTYLLAYQHEGKTRAFSNNLPPFSFGHFPHVW